MRRSVLNLGCVLLSLAVQTGCQLGDKAREIASDFSSTTAAKPSQDNSIRSDGELSHQESALLAFRLAESMELKDLDRDAIAQYEKARQLDPSLNERAARRLAVLYDKLDNQAQAMIEFQQLLKSSPRDPDLLSDLGYSYYNRGEWAEAEKHLREAIRQAKDHKRAHVNLGLALAQQGRQQEALEIWMQAISPAEAYSNLAFICLTQGKREEAKAAYREALRVEPTMTLAKRQLEQLDKPIQPVSAETVEK